MMRTYKATVWIETADGMIRREILESLVEAHGTEEGFRADAIRQLRAADPDVVAVEFGPVSVYRRGE